MTEAPPPIDPAVARAWTCPTCEVETASPYCGACGERRMAPQDLTLAALASQAIESVTDADGRVFRTFVTLAAKPGALTVAYLRGERKRYIGPVQLFLIANVVFFFVQALLGVNSLSNDLDSHLDGQNYSGWVRPLAERVLAERGTTRAEYAPVFDHAVEVNAKGLAFMMVPLFALLAFLLSPRSGEPTVAHVVFGLHFEAYMLLVMTIAMPIIGVPLLLMLNVVSIPEKYADVILAWLLIAIFAVHAYFAFGRVYGGASWARVLKGVVFAVLFIGVLRVYRLLVFFVTFYTA